jgi:hypothetical protein
MGSPGARRPSLFFIPKYFLHTFVTNSERLQPYRSANPSPKGKHIRHKAWRNDSKSWNTGVEVSHAI